MPPLWGLLRRFGGWRKSHAGELRSGGVTVAYPPVDPGLPARSVTELLSSHAELLGRLKLSYGADQAAFDKDLLTPIRRYADYVQLLPATPDSYFAGAGGLLRMGLEIAFYALQATDGHIFSGGTTISKRRQLEPRWRRATFLAGLCSEIHRTLSHLRVADRFGEEWGPYMYSLGGWLGEKRRARYYVSWVPDAQETRALGVFALPHIVVPETLHYLAEGNSVIVPHLLASVSGMPLDREESILEKVVRRASALVIDRDVRASTDRSGKPQLGAHLERYLIDAMRRLVISKGSWVPNASKSRVWYGEDGLYLVWPGAGIDMCALLESDRLPGVPKAPETILDILIEAGVLERRAGARPVWSIRPPHEIDALDAVRLSRPSILLSALDRSPERVGLLVLGERELGPTGAARDPGRSESRVAAVGSLREPAGPVPLVSVPAAQESGLSGVTWQAVGETRPARVFALDPPARLVPGVRAALSAIVDSLNRSGSEVGARSIAEGLFVPLHQFVARGIDGGMALRALNEAAMVVAPPSGGQTFTREFGGTEVVGLVLAPRFVVGFDPGDFLASEDAGAARVGA